MVPKSILIRCAKCQIHQKQSIMRCAKCAKILRHATVRSHLWHSLDENAICVYYFFYSSFSPISIKIYHHLHVQSLIFCFSISTLPYSFLLPSSLFLYSLLIHESWATTDFLSTISQIPPSLIYIISFTGFSPPFFALSSLTYDLIRRETETA